MLWDTHNFHFIDSKAETQINYTMCPRDSPSSVHSCICEDPGGPLCQEGELEGEEMEGEEMEGEELRGAAGAHGRSPARGCCWAMQLNQGPSSMWLSIIRDNSFLFLKLAELGYVLLVAKSLELPLPENIFTNNRHVASSVLAFLCPLSFLVWCGLRLYLLILLNCLNP